MLALPRHCLLFWLGITVFDNSHILYPTTLTIILSATHLFGAIQQGLGLVPLDLDLELEYSDLVWYIYRIFKAPSAKDDYNNSEIRLCIKNLL